MLSQTAESALRAVLWLAARQREAHTVTEISSATRRPRARVARALSALEQAGLVARERSGFKLAVAPRDLTALAVVQSVDATSSDANAILLERTLGEMRIADLLVTPEAASRLCQIG